MGRSPEAGGGGARTAGAVDASAPAARGGGTWICAPVDGVLPRILSSIDMGAEHIRPERECIRYKSNRMKIGFALTTFALIAALPCAAEDVLIRTQSATLSAVIERPSDAPLPTVLVFDIYANPESH